MLQNLKTGVAVYKILHYRIYYFTVVIFMNDNS